MLQELNEQGITVVLVTHDARVARHAQRVVHIRDGRVVLDEMVEDRIIASRRSRRSTTTLQLDEIEAISVNAKARP